MTRTQPFPFDRRLFRLLLAGTLLGAGPALAAEGGNPSWTPAASERLVKLPSTYLKRAIDHDFAGSELATAITDTTRQIKDKVRTLSDLEAAVNRASGDVRTELRHQFLAEKREFIMLNGRREELMRKSLKTRISFYERLIDKMDLSSSSLEPNHAKFLEDHAAASQRFESTVANIDLKLLNSSLQPESKYSREYNKNMAAIQKLVQTINSHPLNQEAEIAGTKVDKKEYLRNLIADAQSEMALVDQEETILGYMAKLVALDAMALSEEVGGDLADGPEAEQAGTVVTSGVEFFTAH